MAADYDKLPPTQQLILEVLAARNRLGDALWTFGTNVSSSLTRLEDAGLISIMRGTTEKTLRASLTDAGAALVLDPSYTVRGQGAATEVTAKPGRSSAGAGVTVTLARDDGTNFQHHDNGDVLLVTIHAPIRTAFVHDLGVAIEKSLMPGGHEAFMAPASDGAPGMFSFTSRPREVREQDYVRHGTGVLGDSHDNHGEEAE